MTHASVELIEAIRGRAPRWFKSLDAWFESGENDPACGAPLGLAVGIVLASAGIGIGGGGTFDGRSKPTDEDLRPVECPACQVAMDAALEGRVLARGGFR